MLESNHYTDIHHHYQFVSVLGHGQFGVVRKAVSVDPAQREAPVAIKSIPKTQITRDITLLKRELEALHSVDHPNVVRLLKTYEDEKYLHIVMELSTGGDLMERVENHGTFSERAASEVMQKLLSGVHHLHSSYICHRDIKPENILYESKAENSEIKIADFGMAIKFGQSQMTDKVGTPFFVAPEVVKGRYGKECDIWSLGVVLYVLLSGTYPFFGIDIPSVLKKSAKGVIKFNDSLWEGISIQAKDLIKAMLTVNPAKRITIPDALNHPWFKQTLQPDPVIVPIDVLNSLKQHRAGNRLYNEAVKVIVGSLTSGQIYELRAVFRSLDVHNTGYITAEGLTKALQLAGMTLAHGEIQSKP